MAVATSCRELDVQDCRLSEGTHPRERSCGLRELGSTVTWIYTGGGGSKNTGFGQEWK